MRNKAKTTARMESLLTKEIAQGIEQYVFLSFCDTKKNEGNKFLGGIICKAFGVTDALNKTHELGINPGGQVFMYILSFDAGTPYTIRQKRHIDQSRDKLLSRDYLETLGI